MMHKDGKQVSCAAELEVYQLAYKQAMDIFWRSKTFPREETYSLTDQVRRSSRSVCTNLTEAWAKRRYQAHFLSKLTDCDGENKETADWLNFARDCKYLESATCDDLLKTNTVIGAMIGQMIKKSSTFILDAAPSSR